MRLLRSVSGDGEMFDFDADVFAAFFNEDFADISLIDFLVVEVVFFLEDILGGFDGVVVVRVSS